MSDFSVTNRCHKCGKRYAPDDGACCPLGECSQCGGELWTDEEAEAGECENCENMNTEIDESE